MKIKGFTILEVSLVLLLSGLVVALVYSTIEMGNRSYRNMESIAATCIDDLTLRQMIRDDVSSSSNTDITNDSLKLFGKDTVIYYRSEGELYRKFRGTELKITDRLVNWGVENRSHCINFSIQKDTSMYAMNVCLRNFAFDQMQRDYGDQN